MSRLVFQKKTPKKNLLIPARPLSPLTRTKSRDIHVDIDIGAVMYGLRAHFRFSRSKDRDENLSEAMSDNSRTIRVSLLSKVDRHFSQFKLASAI